MRYIDTSLLVAAFTLEAATDRALAFLKRSRDEPLLISEWVGTEFMAALSAKIRTQSINEAYRARAAKLFERTVSEAMEVAPVTTSDFREAARLASEHTVTLRAGDALHLAITQARQATLCTLDKRLAKAGKALGITTTLL